MKLSELNKTMFIGNAIIMVTQTEHELDIHPEAVFLEETLSEHPRYEELHAREVSFITSYGDGRGTANIMVIIDAGETELKARELCRDLTSRGLKAFGYSDCQNCPLGNKCKFKEIARAIHTFGRYGNK